MSTPEQPSSKERIARLLHNVVRPYLYDDGNLPLRKLQAEAIAGAISILEAPSRDPLIDRAAVPPNESPDEGCICKGNWRSIVKECESLIHQKFTSGDGREFTFFGVVHGSDDYYYGMYSKDNGTLLLSCVGSLETHGYTAVTKEVR